MASKEANAAEFARFSRNPVRYRAGWPPMPLPIDFYQGMKVAKLEGGQDGSPVIATLDADSNIEVKQRFVIQDGHVVRVDDIEEEIAGG